MKKKIITFGGINKSFKYILLVSISNILNIYIYGFTYIECFYPMNIYKSLHNWILDKDDDCFRHRVFDPFFSYIGVIIISLIFLRERNIKEEDKDIKKENIEEEEKSENTENILEIKYNGNIDHLKSIKGFFYYILIIFLWIAEENLLLIYVDIFQDLDFWFFELIFVSLIYSRLFRSKILSHQKLGMAISIIIGSLLKIVSISLTFSSGLDEKVFYSKNKWLISFVFIYFLLILLRSYVNTQLKIFFDLKYISQRVLLTSYGIVGVIILGLTGLFTSNVTCSEKLKGTVCKFEYEGKLYYDNFYNYYESFKNMLVRLIVIFFGTITFFFDKYYSTLIIKLYSPIHAIFSFPVQNFLEKAFLLIFTAIFFREHLFNGENKLQKFLLDEFGDFFSIIGFLIYLEIIELHFCNLDYNLKNNIIKRSNTEIQELASFIGMLEEDEDLVD